MPGGTVADERDRARALEIARRGAILQAEAQERDATAANDARSEQAQAASKKQKKAYQEAQNRMVWNVANKFIIQGVFAETFIAPIIGILIDDLRFVAVNILHTKRIPFLPQEMELPDFEAWETILLVFQNLVGIPLLLILNPFVLVPLIIIAILS